MIDVTFIEGDTRQRLKRLGAAVGLSVRDMAHEQMRLSCTSAIKWTFPHKKSDGKNRVEKDIRKIFFPMSGEEIEAEWRIPGVLGGAIAFKTKTDAVYGVDSDSYKPNASIAEMNKAHSRQRQPATGRVTTARGGSETGRNSLDIGRWKFVDRMHVKEKRLKEFIKFKQQHVGQLKAGWLPATNYYAAKARGNVVAPPWVKSQENQIGTYQDTMGKSGNGTMTASNTVPYWSTPKRTEIENLVHSIAQKRIDRTTQGQINKLAERFNTGRI